MREKDTDLVKAIYVTYTPIFKDNFLEWKDKIQMKIHIHTDG